MPSYYEVMMEKGRELQAIIDRVQAPYTPEVIAVLEKLFPEKPLVADKSETMKMLTAISVGKDEFLDVAVLCEGYSIQGNIMTIFQDTTPMGYREYTPNTDFYFLYAEGN